MTHSKDFVKTQVTLRGDIAAVIDAMVVAVIDAMVVADEREPAEVIRGIVTRWVRANRADLVEQYGVPGRGARTVIPYEQKR